MLISKNRIYFFLKELIFDLTIAIFDKEDFFFLFLNFKNISKL